MGGKVQAAPQRIEVSRELLELFPLRHNYKMEKVDTILQSDPKLFTASGKIISDPDPVSPDPEWIWKKTYLINFTISLENAQL